MRVIGGQGGGAIAVVYRPLVADDFLELTPRGISDKNGLSNGAITVHPSNGTITWPYNTTAAPRDGVRDMAHLRLNTPTEYLTDGTTSLALLLDTFTHPGQDGPMVGFSICDRDADTTDPAMVGMGAGVRFRVAPVGSLVADCWDETANSSGTTTQLVANDPLFMAKIWPFNDIGGPTGPISTRQATLAVVCQGRERDTSNSGDNCALRSFSRTVTDEVFSCLSLGMDNAAAAAGTIVFRGRWASITELSSDSFYSAGG